MADEVDFFAIRLRDLALFEQVAALGSITAAARRIRVPKPTASRWLAGLERRVGYPLVRRTTRRVALTEQGKAFRQQVSDILAAADAARLALHGELRTGTLRVALPVPLGRVLAGPVIGELRRRLPQVRLEIRLQSRPVDLLRDRLDLAVVSGELADSDLIARTIATASMWLYASARFDGDEVQAIPCIAAPGDPTLLRRSRVGGALGAPVVTVDDRTAVADALVWGAGAGLLPSFLGEPRREQGALIRLDDQPVATVPVHALYHGSQRGDPRLRILIDEIARQLERVL